MGQLYVLSPEATKNCPPLTVKGLKYPTAVPEWQTEYSNILECLLNFCQIIYKFDVYYYPVNFSWEFCIHSDILG